MDGKDGKYPLVEELLRRRCIFLQKIEEEISTTCGGAWCACRSLVMDLYTSSYIAVQWNSKCNILDPVLVLGCCLVLED